MPWSSNSRASSGLRLRPDRQLLDRLIPFRPALLGQVQLGQALPGQSVPGLLRQRGLPGRLRLAVPALRPIQGSQLELGAVAAQADVHAGEVGGWLHLEQLAKAGLGPVRVTVLLKQLPFHEEQLGVLGKAGAPRATSRPGKARLAELTMSLDQ